MKRGLPVTISTNGLGMPVVPVTKGAPLATVSDNGRGQPIVLADHGQPFVFADEDIPKLIFNNGQQGVMLDLSDTSTLFQDAAGTMPVTSPGDPVGLIKRIAGTADAVQAVGAARATYQDGGTPRVVLDKVDDNYSIDFTGTGGFEATWYQGSKEGLVVGKLLIPNGVWNLARNAPGYFPSNNVMGLIIVEGEVSESMDAAIRQWFADRGCGMDFGTMTSFAQLFRYRQDVVELDCVHWDTSSVTSFSGFVYGCSSLTTLDTSSWDTSSVTNFWRFAYECSSLVVLDVSNWDTSSVTGFSGFASGCSSLVTLDTSSWDTSSVTVFSDFAYGCSSLVTLDTSSWDTSSVTNFNYFASNSGIQLLDMRSWDLTSVNADWGWFMRNASNLTTVLVAPGKSFSTITYGNLSSYTFKNTNLTQESIDNILVNLETCAVDNGTFGQSGGSAPSAIGEAAIDALRLRGWTITVTGGY